MVEKLAKCIMDNDKYNIYKDKIYKLTSVDGDFSSAYRLYMTYTYKKLNNFDLNLHHFDFLLTDTEALDFIKNKLDISDSDILIYSDLSYDNKYCLKYKNKIIFLHIEFKYNLPCILHVDIDNHIIDNYLTKDGLTHTCNFIKFLFENSEGE